MDGFTLFSEFFFVRFLINTLTMFILVRLVYFSTYQKRDLFFTFYLLNFIVFLLAFMLEKAKAFNSLGSAFGLLAAFSLLRFRTETISTKDMTYLFIVMAIGLINSIMKGSLIEIAATNAMIVGAVFVVDSNRLMAIQKTKTIDYGSLENIKPEQNAQLIEELRQKTGLDIRRTSIEEIDFVRNKVVIKIYYF
jgi:hypothetical protein